MIIEISGGSPIQSTGRICYINKNVFRRFKNELITSNFCKAISLTDIKILALLKEKPSITQNEIAVHFDMYVPSVKRNMKKLLEAGHIVRKGGKLYGYWEIK
ncbi:MAG: winged helix-turn-helix domain-containing protein [Lachnospiraceae bacterium]|nr:winged helix-turn-helix domain-containing protein [Lachnospiraceae bacterium]